MVVFWSQKSKIIYSPTLHIFFGEKLMYITSFIIFSLSLLFTLYQNRWEQAINFFYLQIFYYWYSDETHSCVFSMFSESKSNQILNMATSFFFYLFPNMDIYACILE